MAVLKAAEVEAKLREYGGNMAAVARSFGVTRQAVHNLVARTPRLRDAVRDCRESMKDEAENLLYAAVRDREAWAVCFFLKTQAKDRGYVERTEHTGAEGSSLELVKRVVVSRGDAPGGSGPAPAANGVHRE